MATITWTFSESPRQNMHSPFQRKKKGQGVTTKMLLNRISRSYTMSVVNL